MTSPHDRPHADELVAAVREFLENDVMGATEGRVQFHTRVAINALRMVERELNERDGMVDAHRSRLDAFGVADDEELSEAIREGRLDDRWDEVTDAVYLSVLDKLRVANPGYLDDD